MLRTEKKVTRVYPIEWCYYYRAAKSLAKIARAARANGKPRTQAPQEDFAHEPCPLTSGDESRPFVGRQSLHVLCLVLATV